VVKSFLLMYPNAPNSSRPIRKKETADKTAATQKIVNVNPSIVEGKGDEILLLNINVRSTISHALKKVKLAV
jgi:hypothetical protein